MTSPLVHHFSDVRAWLWRTFVYDRMMWPANWVQRIYVKTHGYPLPKILQPAFTVRARQQERDGWELASSYWTPIGQTIYALRLHRRGGYVRMTWR